MFDDQLSLSAGYRFDSFSFYEKNSNSGKVGFCYKPTGARWLVRGNVGRSFSAPAFNQLLNSAQPFGIPNLTAETLTLYELGGELSATDALRLGASVFYAKHKDPIFPRQVDQCVLVRRPAYRPASISSATCSRPPEYVGATLTADWAFATHWLLGASDTWTDPRTAHGYVGIDDHYQHLHVSPEPACGEGNAGLHAGALHGGGGLDRRPRPLLGRQFHGTGGRLRCAQPARHLPGRPATGPCWRRSTTSSTSPTLPGRPSGDWRRRTIRGHHPAGQLRSAGTVLRPRSKRPRRYGQRAAPSPSA